MQDFNASDTTNLIDVYDNADLTEQKSGKTTSELSISQLQRGLLNSIYRLKGLDLYFCEAITDGRALTKTDGSAKYYELRIYRGKLNNMSETKGDAEALYTIEGTGSYTVSSKQIIQAGVTPVTVAISGTDNAATAATPESYTITATDFLGDTIDITDLTADALMGEITSITIEKVSGTPTISVADGADDATKAVTYTGTGECVVRAKIVTANGGTFYSTNKTVTVS